MPDKREKISVLTGEYAFKLPPMVNMTLNMPVELDPIEEELKVSNSNTGLIGQLSKGVVALSQVIGLVVLIFAAAAVVAWYAMPRDMKDNTIIALGLRPQPPKVDMTRYVITRGGVLAENPGGSGERYALEKGYPVTYLGETHEFDNGKVWMRVRAQYGSPSQPQSVYGWMEAGQLSE
jgi:hypothetical protein